MLHRLLVICCLTGLWERRVGGFRDPDLPESQTPMPTIPSNLNATAEVSRWQGLMFAGMLEFNWVVNIRDPNRDLDEWSVGNAVTYYHVMTSCKAVVHQSRWLDSDRFIFEVTKEDLFVDFCSNYLRNESYRFSEEGAYGSRSVMSISVHPKCDPYSMLFDFAMLTLKDGIHPLVPLVGYMPIPGEWHLRPDPTAIRKHLLVCYIATFGKRYRNLQGQLYYNNLLVDRKIKFRVYHVDWNECEDTFFTMCPKNVPACGYFHSIAHMNSDVKKKLSCFRPRKKVGAVCNHDRGAPLVCGGFVYGIVVQGVPSENCHNLLQYPVLVLDSYDFVQELVYDIWISKVKAVSGSGRNFVDTILKVATSFTVLLLIFR
ncbi:hypothetical protein GE061_018938 [Apolygus lucorum]|uniref:Peptidase S1 domain-containing protein n=1 Tax=Apolygus lucorum TaxID=248454 RepID=A0A8S9X9N4_APOLU|nr:hypothetical protein GE061_018938 [Apolygus lucorum]